MNWTPSTLGYTSAVEAMLADGPTAPLADFVAAYGADDNLWWVVGCGHHQNLFDAAMEVLDAVRQLAEVANQEGLPVPADLIIDRLEGR